MKHPTYSTLFVLALAYLLTPIIAAPHEARTYQPKAIKWERCPTAVPKGIDCATFSVPLDWNEPNGEKITLGMNRLRSTNDTADNLFIHAGGPGVIVTRHVLGLATGASPISSALIKKYNIIGLDPRGIGSSTPIKCDIDLFNERVSSLPQTDADFRKLKQHNTALGESCLKLSGNIIRHMDTLSVARDFEAVRQAVGSAKFNLMGYSYGTVLAATYAELFPQNVGRIVMDGIVDHSQTEPYFTVTDVTTYENVFNRFAEWCSSSSDCALHGQNVGQLFDDLLEKADKTPIPAPACGLSCRPDVSGEELRFSARFHLFFKDSWTSLGQGIAQALQGNATLLSVTPAKPDATEANTFLFANIAVGCLDWTWAGDQSLSGLLYLSELTASLAPHTKGGRQWHSFSGSCVGWPVPVQYPPRRVEIKNTPPILMVNALYDPASSYTWAVGMQEQISSAVLLTRKGDGHTSYRLGGEASELMDAYLIEGKMPARNTIVNS